MSNDNDPAIKSTMPKHPRGTTASGINCTHWLRTLFGRRTYGSP